MLFLAAISLILYLLFRRGIDLFSIAATSVVFYYYPLLAFEHIYWQAGVLRMSEVSIASTATIFLMVLAYFFWALAMPVRNFGVDNFSRKKIALLFWCSLIISASLALVLLYKNSLHDGSSKANLMATLGHELKVYEAAATIFFICSHIIGGRFRMLVSVLLVTIALYIGFRFLAVSFVLSYFVLRPVRNRKNVLIIGIGLLGISFFLLAAKIFYYRIPELIEIENIVEAQLKGDNLFQNLSIANTESSSVSVVYNEILKNDFHLESGYWVDVFISILPAPSLFGFEQIDGFADVYKSNLQISGIDSFAGTMFGLGYAAFWYPGLILFVLFHLHTMLAGWLIVQRRTSSYLRVLIVYCLVVGAFFAHRNDVIYNISLVKSALVVVAAAFVIDIFIGGFFGSRSRKK